MVHGFHHLHSGVRSNPTSFYEFRKFAIVVAKKLTEALLAKLPEHLENVTYGGKVANGTSIPPSNLYALTGQCNRTLGVSHGSWPARSHRSRHHLKDRIQLADSKPTKHHNKQPSGAEDLARNGKFTSTLLVTLTYIVSRLALRGGSGGTNADYFRSSSASNLTLLAADGSRNDGMAAADNLFSTLTTLFKSPLAVESLLHSDGLGPLLTLMDFYSKVDNDQWRTRCVLFYPK